MLFIGMFVFQCHSNKVVYDLPDTISKDAKRNFTAYLDEGQALYKINCSNCHGIIGNGIDSIPNFTKLEIETYKAKLALKNENTHGAAEKLSYQQIESILHFLTFRKLK